MAEAGRDAAGAVTIFGSGEDANGRSVLGGDEIEDDIEIVQESVRPACDAGLCDVRDREERRRTGGGIMGEADEGGGNGGDLIRRARQGAEVGGAEALDGVDDDNKRSEAAGLRDDEREIVGRDEVEAVERDSEAPKTSGDLIRRLLAGGVEDRPAGDKAAGDDAEEGRFPATRRTGEEIRDAADEAAAEDTVETLDSGRDEVDGGRVEAGERNGATGCVDGGGATTGEGEDDGASNNESEADEEERRETDGQKRRKRNAREDGSDDEDNEGTGEDSDLGR